MTSNDQDIRLEAAEEMIGRLSSDFTKFQTQIRKEMSEQTTNPSTPQEEQEQAADKAVVVTIDKKKYEFYKPKFFVVIDGVSTLIEAAAAKKDKALCAKILEAAPHTLIPAK